MEDAIANDDRYRGGKWVMHVGFGSRHSLVNESFNSVFIQVKSYSDLLLIFLFYMNSSYSSDNYCQFLY